MEEELKQGRQRRSRRITRPGMPIPQKTETFDLETADPALIKELEEYVKISDRIDVLKQLQPEKNFLSLDNDESIGVFQGDVVYTDPYSKHPVVASYGARPCIILACRNPETGESALAHIDAVTNLKFVHTILNNISGETNAAIEVHIATIVEHSSEKQSLYELCQILEKHENVEIKSAILKKLPGNKISGARFALDSRTGEIYTNFTPQKLNIAGIENDKDFDRKAMMRGMTRFKMGLSTTFDGRNISAIEQDFIYALEAAFVQAGVKQISYKEGLTQAEDLARDNVQFLSSDKYEIFLETLQQKYPDLRKENFSQFSKMGVVQKTETLLQDGVLDTNEQNKIREMADSRNIDLEVKDKGIRMDGVIYVAETLDTTSVRLPSETSLLNGFNASREVNKVLQK